MTNPTAAPSGVNARTTRLNLTRDQQIGVGLILLSVFSYSLLPVFTSFLRGEGMEPIPIALWRFGIALPFYWLIARVRRHAEREPDGRRLPWGRLMLSGSLFALASAAAFYGLQRVPAGTFVVIFYTYPAMVAILSLFLGERLTGWGWAAVALTIIGVTLTAPDFSAGLRGENFTGVALALVNAFVVALYFIISSRLLRGYRAISRASAITVTGTLLVLLLMSLTVRFQVPQGSAWVHLLGLSLFSTVMPILAVNNGIQRLGATKAALFGTIEPLITAVFAMLFIGEQMQLIQWLGGLVIIASVIVLQTLGAPRKPVPVTEQPALDAVL